MSEVISFRLNEDNLREAKALLILQEWRAKGYSNRSIITDALLNLEEGSSESSSQQFDELNEKFSQLLKQLSNGDPALIIKSNRPTGNSELADHFIASIKKSAKSGLTIS